MGLKVDELFYVVLCNLKKNFNVKCRFQIILLKYLVYIMELFYFYSTILLHNNESFNPLKVIRKSKMKGIKKGLQVKLPIQIN